MGDKSRVTKIIAHCSKSTLLKKFPDYETKERLVLSTKGGGFLDEIRTPGPEAVTMIKTIASMAGLKVTKYEQKVQDTGWVSINNSIYSVSEISERKCSIHFKTYNKDEEVHYEKVDEIVKELALKDVAVLKGECSITITTRC
jgi:hypothetical protein